MMGQRFFFWLVERRVGRIERKLDALLDRDEAQIRAARIKLQAARTSLARVVSSVSTS